MIFFKNIHLLPLIWVVVALLPLLVGEYYLRRAQHSRFTHLLEKSPLRGDQLRRSFYLLAAGGLLFVALLRPSWNPSVHIVEQEGRDVVFLVDVSRSMTASDVAPTRLERAKIEIQETLQIIEGDRIGLVAFAGNSVVKSPLTLDYGFFEMVLDDLSPNSVSKGGSQLGDALRMVESQVFDDQVREQRDIILITDGEDQDSFPVEAAQALGSQGVRLIIIGLGDELQGARVKDSEGNYLTYEGQEVWSRMEGDILRKMAAATKGGRYLGAGQANFSLPQVYKSLITQGTEKSTGKEETLIYEEKFQFFLALAILFIVLEGLRIMGKIDYRKIFTSRASSLPILFFLLFMGSGDILSAQGKADLYKEGEQALEAQDWDSFNSLYERLTEKGADQGKVAYNRGRSLYNQEDFKGAADSFGEAASLLEGEKAAQALYNRGNSLVKQADGDQENGSSLVKQAVESYLKALELDPSLVEAARNLELLNQQEPPPESGENGDESQEGDPQEGSDSQNSQGENQQSGDQSSQSSEEGQNPQDQQEQEGQSSQGEENMTEEEKAAQRAQEILDKEEQEREERESTLLQSGGIYQVDKDW